MITLEVARLNAALKLAASVVEARNTIPILANVSLHAEGNVLELVGTDMDVEFAQKIECSIEETLSTTVDARRFAAVVNRLDNGAQVTLTLLDSEMEVKSGRGRWRLPVLPRTDFPRLEFNDGSHSTSMSCSALLTLIGAVLWSRSTEGSRYYLNGPLLHGEKGLLSLVATNGHTMAYLSSETDWPDGADEIILAPKWCALMERICGDADGEIALCWNAARIRAEIGDCVLTGKVIDGTFPDWRRVVPPDSEPLLIDPEQAAKALRNVMVIVSEKTRIAKVSTNDGVCEFSCLSVGTGDARFECAIDGGWQHDAGFNGEYLANALAAVGGDTVEIHQANPKAPVLCRRVTGQGPICVVMPCSV